MLLPAVIWLLPILSAIFFGSGSSVPPTVAVRALAPVQAIPLRLPLVIAVGDQDGQDSFDQDLAGKPPSGTVVPLWDDGEAGLGNPSADHTVTGAPSVSDSGYLPPMATLAGHVLAVLGCFISGWFAKMCRARGVRIAELEAVLSDSRGLETGLRHRLQLVRMEAHRANTDMSERIRWLEAVRQQSKQVITALHVQIAEAKIKHRKEEEMLAEEMLEDKKGYMGHTRELTEELRSTREYLSAAQKTVGEMERQRRQQDKLIFDLQGEAKKKDHHISVLESSIQNLTNRLNRAVKDKDETTKKAKIVDHDLASVRGAFERLQVNNRFSCQRIQHLERALRFTNREKYAAFDALAHACDGLIDGKVVAEERVVAAAALADAQHQIRTLQAELALQKEVAEAEKAKLTREHQETEGAAAEALEQVEAQLAKERSDWKRIRRQLELTTKEHGNAAQRGLNEEREEHEGTRRALQEAKQELEEEKAAHDRTLLANAELIEEMERMKGGQSPVIATTPAVPGPAVISSAVPLARSAPTPSAPVVTPSIVPVAHPAPTQTRKVVPPPGKREIAAPRSRRGREGTPVQQPVQQFAPAVGPVSALPPSPPAEGGGRHNQ